MTGLSVLPGRCPPQAHLLTQQQQLAARMDTVAEGIKLAVPGQVGGWGRRLVRL